MAHVLVLNLFVIMVAVLEVNLVVIAILGTIDPTLGM